MLMFFGNILYGGSNSRVKVMDVYSDEVLFIGDVRDCPRCVLDGILASMMVVADEDRDYDVYVDVGDDE